MKLILVIGDANSIHTFRWAQHLHALNFRVIVIPSNYSNYYSTSLDYSIFFKYHTVRYGFLSKHSKLVRALKRFYYYLKAAFFYKPDVINFLSLSLEYAIFSIVNLKKSRLVFNLMGSDIYHSFNNAFLPIKKYSLNKAWAILATTPAIKDELLKYIPTLKTETFHWVPWGIDTKLFSMPTNEEKTKLRKNIGISKDDIVIFSIRTLRPLYNIHKIIEEFIEANLPNKYKLLIRIPPYSDKNYIEKCKNIANFKKNIIFHEVFLEHDQLAELYKISDFFVSFAQTDAGSVCFAEAVASGCFPLLSNKIPTHLYYKELGFKLINCPIDELHSYFNLSLKKEDIISNHDLALKYFDETATKEKLKKLF